MSDGWVGEGRVRYCEIASPMRNVTSRTANYAHSSRRNDYETLSPLFPLFPSFASVTCRSDRLGSIGCLPRNGGATFRYRTIPRFINIHSWNEDIYVSFIETIESASRRLNSVPFECETRANRQEYPRCSKWNRFIGKNW